MKDRNLTIKQEIALRLCHHEFGHLPIEEAARIMGLGVRQVAYLLWSAKKKAPSLFPILTHQQWAILQWWKSNIPEPPDEIYCQGGGIKGDIAFLKKHKFIVPKPETVRFNSAYHEGHVKEKF